MLYKSAYNYIPVYLDVNFTITFKEKKEKQHFKHLVRVTCFHKEKIHISR